MLSVAVPEVRKTNPRREQSGLGAIAMRTQACLARRENCMQIGNQVRGEINVAEVMAEQERLAAWLGRQQREVEWIALKQWWQADRAVRQAETPSDRQRAIALRARTEWLYREALKRAWLKWHRAQEELRARPQGRRCG